MLIQNGHQQLQDFTNKNYKQTITEVTKGVWFVLGLGHSNAIFIEAGSSVILIDTLDTRERGEQLLDLIRQNTKKEVGTIIYTHGHPDHRGGAGAFMDSRPEIIAFAPAAPALEKTGLLQDIQNLRGARQFGYPLTDQEAISQGIGPREGITHGEHRAFVLPTTLYEQDKVSREIDGVQLEMVRLPGESEEEIMIWLPQKKVLCCGDNFYGCFPNLYAIRGGQYRDLAAWIHSIDVLMSYPAEYLLPGHTAAILGHETISSTLGKEATGRVATPARFSQSISTVISTSSLPQLRRSRRALKLCRSNSRRTSGHSRRNGAIRLGSSASPSRESSSPTRSNP